MTTATTSALVQKFLNTEVSMNTRLVERSDIVKTSLVAIVSKRNVFFLGQPGTAKSLSVRLLRDHIDGFRREDYFEVLLTPFSTDSTVFGPPDIIAMENGVYCKVVDNTLAQALMAFVDEEFKANDSTLNSLLTALNEKLFHNGNKETLELPLWSLFGASNELPHSTELEALYDRMHLRHQVKPIQGSGGFVQMLKNRWVGKVVPTLTVADIVQAQEEVAQVTISNEVYDGLSQLRQELRAEGIEPTDRRFSDTLPVIQATAWFSGSTEAGIDDMRLIRHMLWTRPDEQAVVNAQVLNLASPLEAKANALKEDVEKLAEELDTVLRDSDNQQQRNRKAIDLHTKLDRAAIEITEIDSQISSTGRRSEVVDDVKARVTSMIDHLLNTVFNIDPNNIKGK